MDSSSLNIDGILESVLSNPEMLRGAMTLAKSLASSGAFSATKAGESEKERAYDGATESDNGRELLSGTYLGDMPPSKSLSSVHEDAKGRKESQKPADTRHRKLLEALALYMDEEKRGKMELIIRLLDLLELAGNMRQ